MNDDDSHSELFEVVFVFEASIERNKNVKLFLDAGQQEVILQSMPAHFKGRPNLMPNKNFGGLRINTRV